ncbi:GNAT family N-acetyltransferase [Hymenobacter sp. BT635]|uniref:GNAT family N-acetyltransferase n=1 Tax=Hymenobacter nitidus TaxID=2880929 RepID=A0ABS8AH62_9BACT|nr:GNAT family protein [Hymenobacter nitidus]MCB2378560.1 GNAT family N-acetyltransferase [Hymenobacter nitidus]
MLTIQLTPFPVLHTPRLTLRQLTPDDAPAMLFFRSDEEFLRYIPREKETTLAQAQQHLRLLDKIWADNEGVTWAISRRGQTELLGTICLWHLQPENYRAEVGYGLHPAHARQGLMAEALAAVVAYSFGPLGLHSLEAQVAPDNAASIRLLEKQGFVREGYFREIYHFRGNFLDTAVYSLLAPRP